MKLRKCSIFILVGIILLVIGVCLLFTSSKKYEVVFVNNNNRETVEVKSGDTVQEIKVNDDSFDGWYEELSTTKFDFTTKIEKDYVLVAKYKDEVSITFDTDGGSLVKSINVYQGTSVEMPESPVKDGYKFAGWELNGEDYDFSTKVDDNVTLKAKWVESDENVTITFDTDGGTNIEPVVIRINTTIDIPSSPQKNGYDFVQWNYNDEKFDFSTKILKDITLKAVWNEKEKVSVRFVSDGRTINTISVIKGEAIKNMPSTPIKDGYVFTGWYSGGNIYYSSSKVYDSITLNAGFITQDRYNLNNMINNLKNANISMNKGGEDLVSQINNNTSCVITATNTPSSIKRDVSNTTVSVTFNVTCGSETSSTNVNVTINSSPYTYTKTANGNMINYDVIINGGQWNSDAKLFLGNEGSFNVLSRKAVVENAKIENNPVFQMRFNNDSSTLYVVRFAG